MRRKSLFYYVVKRGCVDIVKLLIDKEVFVNICDKVRKFLLYWVVKNGFLSIVEIFIDKKVDVN